VVCGDGEYIIHTALSFRNKSFGQGLEFVWAADSSEYAVRESNSKIKVRRAWRALWRGPGSTTRALPDGAPAHRSSKTLRRNHR
jgi:hypothetical protein